MSLLYWAGFVFLCVFPLAAASVKLYRIFEKDRPFRGGVLAWYILVPLIVTIIAYNILLINFATVSRVDTSPIARLTTEQVASADNILDWLEGQDFFYQYSRRFVFYNDEFAREHRPYEFIIEESQHFHIDGRYFSFWQRETFLWVYVRVYYNEEGASRSIQNQILRNRWERDYVHIINDNNTEILLWQPIAHRRPPGSPWIASWGVSSDIRIGNVVIWLTERRGRHSLNNDLSSMFIERMVEMIKTEAEYD